MAGSPAGCGRRKGNHKMPGSGKSLALVKGNHPQPLAADFYIKNCGYPQSLSLFFERNGKPGYVSPKATKMKPNLKPGWIVKPGLGRQLELFRYPR
ncbi:MAG: hypothetical protein LJE63_15830 [Desulfobacteraceae bacterium]|nr:hypothetical protein [Desulfobacteraceae bacterium]